MRRKLNSAKLFGMSYQLLDSGDGQKLERFGPYTFVRPTAAAIWKPTLAPSVWQQADAIFSREGKMCWRDRTEIEEFWNIDIESLQFQLKRTDFGHLGIFPEQAPIWRWLQTNVGPQMKILNLFSYTGGSTLACAKGGAKVCHVDSARNIVGWARENAELNGLQEAPIRWIVEDAMRFLKRCVRRGDLFDGVILDPPSFGRGAKGELFKIEDDLQELLELCFEVLSEEAKFILLSCHTEGYMPMMLKQVLQQASTRGGSVEAGEMMLEGPNAIPNGVWARWHS